MIDFSQQALPSSPQMGEIWPQAVQMMLEPWVPVASGSADALHAKSAALASKQETMGPNANGVFMGNLGILNG